MRSEVYSETAGDMLKTRLRRKHIVNLYVVDLHPWFIGHFSQDSLLIAIKIRSVSKPASQPAG